MIDSHEHQNEDLVFGRHAVISSLDNSMDRIEKIWVQRGLHFPGRLNESIRAASKSGTVVHFVDRRALDRLTGGSVHQGIALRMSLIDYLTLRDWLKTVSERNALALVLDGIQDSGNVGAIFRTAAAAGVDGIIVPRHGSAPIGGTAMKTSAGTINQIPVVRAGNLRNGLQDLKADGFRVIGITEKASRSVIGMESPERLVLVFGNESNGIRPIDLKECDDTLSIPMTGPAGSLNVSAAVAIVLYERLRNRLEGTDESEKKA